MNKDPVEDRDAYPYIKHLVNVSEPCLIERPRHRQGRIRIPMRVYRWWIIFYSKANVALAAALKTTYAITPTIPLPAAKNFATFNAA